VCRANASPSLPSLPSRATETGSLANEAVEEGEALDAALEITERIASFPQDTLRADRASVYDGLGRSPDDGMRTEE
jgi:enoyl-CoA hydratase/carnithine racemase